MAQRHQVNNWNLMDSSALYTSGTYLLQRDRAVLRTLVVTPVMWDRRIAMLSTFAFSRAKDLAQNLTQLRATLIITLLAANTATFELKRRAFIP